MSCREHGARLTFGCSECIDRVKVDQRRASYTDWTDDELYDEWTLNPFSDDDDLIGSLLIERGVLSVEEVETGVVTAVVS